MGKNPKPPHDAQFFIASRHKHVTWGTCSAELWPGSEEKERILDGESAGDQPRHTDFYLFQNEFTPGPTFPTQTAD